MDRRLHSQVLSPDLNLHLRPVIPLPYFRPFGDLATFFLKQVAEAEALHQ
jgi:hypothetical protein